MQTFLEYMIIEDSSQEVKELSHRIKGIGRGDITGVISKSKAKDIDELIDWLEKQPEVRQFIDAYKKIKNQQSDEQQCRGEFMIAEGVFKLIMKHVGKIIDKSIKWLLKSIIKTIAHVFGGLRQDASGGQKIRYAGLVFMLYLLSGFLFVTGSPLSGITSSGILGVNLTWWFISWFGKNFIEPVIRRAEGTPMAV